MNVREAVASASPPMSPEQASAILTAHQEAIKALKKEHEEELQATVKALQTNHKEELERLKKSLEAEK